MLKNQPDRSYGSSGYLRNGARPQKQYLKTERNRERRDPISEGLSPLREPWRPRTRGGNLSPSRGEAMEEEEMRGEGLSPLSPGGAGVPPGEPSSRRSSPTTSPSSPTSPSPSSTLYSAVHSPATRCNPLLEHGS